MAGVDVVIVNRSVSGETVATSAERMRTEVALARPDLLIWQVGANDALARVPPASYEDDLREGVRWAKDNGVDVLLVGFEANPWLHDDKEVLAVREATSRVANEPKTCFTCAATTPCSSSPARAAASSRATSLFPPKSATTAWPNSWRRRWPPIWCCVAPVRSRQSRDRRYLELNLEPTGWTSPQPSPF